MSLQRRGAAVAGPGMNLPVADQLVPGIDRNFRTDAVGIAPGADRLDAQPVLVVRLIAVENDIGIEIDEQEIEIAVVVEIDGRHADAVRFMFDAPFLRLLGPGLAVESSIQWVAAFGGGPAVAARRIDADID